MPIERLVLLGAGHVGQHLGLALHEQGLDVLQVFSRTIDKARPLAARLGAAYTTKIRDLLPDADLYLLAVSDDAIAEVARSLRQQVGPDRLVAHTSGAQPGSLLRPFFPRSGVFYPLQSLTASRAVAFGQIPLCVCAAKPQDEDALAELAGRLSRSVYRLNDADRAQLHVAAVFANNFSNHLFQLAHELLADRDLPFDLLRPLIAETAAKVQHQLPEAMQTGPACRGDHSTIAAHLALLEDHPHLRQVYRLLSDSIEDRTRIS